MKSAMRSRPHSRKAARASACPSLSLIPKCVFLTKARSKTSPLLEEGLEHGELFESELLDSWMNGGWIEGQGTDTGQMNK